MWAGPLIFLWPPQRCLNNPIFSNLGFCAACWAHFMCRHELWPTSVSHPVFSLNSSLGLAGGKYYQKIPIHISRLVLQNFALPGCFSCILFYCYFFSLLSSVWVVIAVCDYFSLVNLSSIREIGNWFRVAISNDKSTEWLPSPFCCSFLIVDCRLCYLCEGI